MAAWLWPESTAICHRHAFMGWGRAVLPPSLPRSVSGRTPAASLVAVGSPLPAVPEQTAAAKCIEVHKQI